MRVLVVDDHPLVMHALGIVAQRRGLELRFELATSLEDAIVRLGRRPQVRHVILDLLLPGCVGTMALQALRKHHPLVAVTVLSALERPSIGRACVDAGALRFVAKGSDPESLGDALVELMHSRPRQARQASGRVRSESAYLEGRIASILAIAGQDRLSPRRAQVAMHLARGESNREIARALGLAENTVRLHAKAALRLLGVPNRRALVLRVRAAMRDRTLQPADVSPFT